MSALTDIVTKAREGARQAFARPAGYVGAWWERLSPRERRLGTWGGVALACTVTLLGTYLLFSSVADLQDDNAAMRDALTAIAKHRDEYLDAKARGTAQEQRIGNDPPQLTADIEAAAREEKVQIAESSERPVSPAGRRYVEHDVDIKVREVDLQSLTKFLQRLETGPRLIFFTRLSIKKRFSENDKLDVEATATVFERIHEDKTKKKPGSAEVKEPVP
jgi:type II secretory pathway component PulM